MTNNAWANGSLTIAVVIVAIYVIVRISTKSTPASKVTVDIDRKPRSWASNQIRQEFYAIPADHRPSVDLDAILHALDTKHEIENVNRHFMYPNGTFKGVSWTNHPNCSSTLRCPFNEYTKIHDQMAILMSAYREREHALAIAEQEHGFRQLEDLTRALDNETLSITESIHNIRKQNDHSSMK